MVILHGLQRLITLACCICIDLQGITMCDCHVYLQSVRVIWLLDISRKNSHLFLSKNNTKSYRDPTGFVSPLNFDFGLI